MNPHEQLIEEFYAGFAAHNAKIMISCYHPDITFTDPAFGTLTGTDVSDMWSMLIERSGGNLVVEYSNIRADESIGSALWTATYEFSKTKRKVHNMVSSRFEFKDGLIIRHTDEFDIWKWSRQALGFSGKIFGWSPIMKKKIQRHAISSLRKYQQTLKSV
ncbi:MAG: nuclear transport factor 2 family protein [Flavobacterium sp.]|nr:nuclear transport factor 2 family protein [Flavobacterium sp.]